MKSWFFPFSDGVYRLSDALASGNGTTDIRSSYGFEVGDRLFLFRARPENRIVSELEVIRTGIPADESLDKIEFWTDAQSYYNGLMTSNCCRVRIVRIFDNAALSAAALKAHGLRNSVSVDILPEDTLAFILKPFDDYTYGTDYPENTEYYEGALIEVKVNKYERSRTARDKCIELKGCRCVVCGMDFEERYGPIGRRFIHIHHLVPMSSIGKGYKLDIEKDLVPVCPNCHYMLHRKPDGVFTPEELKGMIGQ